MLKRNDDFAKGAFSSSPLDKLQAKELVDGDVAYSQSVRNLSRVLEYYVNEVNS